MARPTWTLTGPLSSPHGAVLAGTEITLSLVPGVSRDPSGSDLRAGSTVAVVGPDGTLTVKGTGDPVTLLASAPGAPVAYRLTCIPRVLPTVTFTAPEGGSLALDDIVPEVPAPIPPVDASTLRAEWQAALVTDHGALTGLNDDDHPNYLTKARADATFRPLVSLAPLKRALNAGTRSVAVQVLGDSTGNDTGEWPDLFSQYLAAQYPAFTVQRRTWSHATQDYGAPVTVQTGTAGPLYQDCSGSVTTGSFRGASSVHLSGTVDVRVKLTAPDWTPATARMIAGQMDIPGTRSWALCLSAAGLPQIMYSTDGAAIAMMSNSAITGLADGATKWLRAVFTPNDGAGNRVLKCYLSDDGLTWTQLGSTVTTAGALTLFNAATDDPYSGFGLGGTAVGVYQPWIGQIHEVDIRDGLDGKSVAPRLPDLWSHIATSSPTASAPVVGAPVLTIVNGSHPGGNIAYLGDATRLPKMTPDYGQALVLTSSSHNERSRVGIGWRTYYATWLGAIAARLVGVPAVILTQNPENGADNATTHAQRRLDLLAFGHAIGRDVIDTYAAFLAAGDWTALLADTVHPNATGSQVWADTVTDTFAATSV